MNRAGGALLVALAVAACAQTVHPTTAPPPAPGAYGAAPAMKGVALALFPSAGWRDFTAELDDLGAIGATWVSLPVFWRQRDVRANDLAPDEAATIPDDRLREIIRAAHARGLRVLLFPIVDLERLAPGEWRGTLRPDDPAAWWARYEAFILHYAAIAAEERVALLSVGSELGSSEEWRDRWIHLIAGVEKLYPGDLIYSANWDRFEGVRWWERIDYVGVNAYFELTAGDDAGEEALAAAWAGPRERLLALAARVERPLVITEIGYPSRDGGAARPWDYTSVAAIDLEEQRRAYAAFARAWGDRRLGGVFFWNWARPGGPEDGDYTPRGKPAEAVLRAWFQ